MTKFTTLLRRGNGQLRREVWVDKNGQVTRYNLAYINHDLHTSDNGRVLGYDNQHGYHHRHYLGAVTAINFVNFEDIESIDLSPVEQMREYVEKIAEPYKGGKAAGTSEIAGTNTKSTVAGKNDMGGTTANIARGGAAPEMNKGTKGGLLDPSTKEDNAGNVNVPGAKNATKLSAVAKGHGAEKKGTGEASGTYTKSLLKPQKG